MRKSVLILSASLLLAGSAVAQTNPPLRGPPPGKPDVRLITGGTYKVDPGHTEVVWGLTHNGYSRLYGLFTQLTGSLQLDPKRPNDAKLVIDVPLSGLKVSSDAFAAHLRTPDLFEADKFPAAHFVSTSVKAKGTRATITGDLTMHGVTRPVVLQATFVGAGPNATGVENVGFSATGRVKRRDFGLGYAAPEVGDDVDLQITGAFIKQAG